MYKAIAASTQRAGPAPATAPLPADGARDDSDTESDADSDTDSDSEDVPGDAPPAGDDADGVGQAETVQAVVAAGGNGGGGSGHRRRGTVPLMQGDLTAADARGYLPRVANTTIEKDTRYHYRWRAYYPKPGRSHVSRAISVSSDRDAMLYCIRTVWEWHTAATEEECPWILE